MPRVSRWAMHYDECQNEHCTTPGKPHLGHGLCSTCYHRQYERKRPPRRYGQLEKFIRDLPLLHKKLGLFGTIASFKDGQVTIKYKNMTATWPE